MSSLPPAHLAQQKKLRGRLATSESGARKFHATVTAVLAGPPKTVTVQQGALSEVAGLRYDARYTPTVGDEVYGLVTDNDYLVIGKLA